MRYFFPRKIFVFFLQSSGTFQTFLGETSYVSEETMLFNIPLFSPVAFSQSLNTTIMSEFGTVSVCWWGKAIQEAQKMLSAETESSRPLKFPPFIADSRDICL